MNLILQQAPFLLPPAACYAIYKRCLRTVAVHSTQNELNITVRRKPGQLSQEEKISLIAEIKKWVGPQGYQLSHWVGLAHKSTSEPRPKGRGIIWIRASYPSQMRI